MSAEAVQGDAVSDTDNGKYANVTELWQAEVNGSAQRRNWYAKGASYWQQQEASINGVLGGYPETHGPDIRESKRFIALLRRSGALQLPPSGGDALDCGAGIGRVTSSLLRHEFGKVDLAEPNERLLAAARTELSNDGRVQRFIAEPLQTLQLARASYDVIWIQWVLLYLPDDDLLEFLQRCAQGLRRGGLICVKENVVLEGNFVIDREDNGVSRTNDEFKAVFSRAGLSLLHELRQTCWPSDLLPVMMYALRPDHIQEEGVPPVMKRSASAEPAPAVKRPASARAATDHL